MLKILLLALVSIATAAYYEDSAAYWTQRINNDPNCGFKAGYNEFFAGKSYEEISALMGTWLEKEERKERKVPLIGVGALPTSFTSGIDNWKNCYSTIFNIKSQANCGDCWAMGASEMAADRTCIANYDQMTPEDNEKHPAISLSAGHLMSCCSHCAGCNGGSIRGPMRCWQDNGYVTGGAKNSFCGCQPYPCPCPEPSRTKGKMITPTCSDKCQFYYNRPFDQDKHYATDYYTVVGEEDMMKEILERGPIECGFGVSGVYNQTEGTKAGGHAIKIIGWGEENGMPYWLVNNSWGTKWGMKGQFKFLRGKNLANMEIHCYSGTAKTHDSNFKLFCP